MLKWLSSLARGNGNTRKNTKKAGSAGRKKSRGGVSTRHKKRMSHAKPAARASSRKLDSNAVRIGRGEHGISRKDIDEHALKVLYRLHKAGFHACLVGGAVRDLLLGQQPKDFDVATDATPEQVKALFRNCRLIGRRFRLAHIHFGRQIIEVATFRAEHDETDDGHSHESGRILRDNVYGDIGEDVWRRDFTVNALYYDIENFSVIDYVNGWQDIHDRKLRLIGDTETRFREDPVRMLRAIRFAAKLNFTIDDEIQQSIYDLGGLLNDIPSARLYEETLKLFHSGHAVTSFELLNQYHLLQYLFPATASAIEDDAATQDFIHLALESTDARVRSGAPITPAFLFAAMLWEPLRKTVEQDVNDGMPYAMAMQQAIAEVVARQVRVVSVPKRFTTVMRDIWSMQARFRYRKGKRAQSLLEHPKFRAAYDFLCLRNQAGESLQEDCDWWTAIQKDAPEDQRKKLKPKPKRARRGRHSGRRNSSPRKQ